jgi:hypothetical protein
MTAPACEVLHEAGTTMSLIQVNPQPRGATY